MPDPQERKFSASLETVGSIPIRGMLTFHQQNRRNFLGIGRMERTWQDSCPTFITSENKNQEVGSMKSPKIVAAIATIFLVTVCLTAAPLQQAPGGPERGGGGQAPPAAPGGPAAQAKTATGELSKVDVAKKEITIKGADSKDMVFVWTDATQMTGVEGGPQGLSGKTGATLRVTYVERGGANQAARIEVQEKK
jgi:hypothetical protein